MVRLGRIGKARCVRVREASQGMVRQARHDKLRQVELWIGEARFGRRVMVRLGAAVCGSFGHGLLGRGRRGESWLGSASYGGARCCEAWNGRHGSVGRGLFWQCGVRSVMAGVARIGWLGLCVVRLALTRFGRLG